MTKTSKLLGKISFWLLWPALYFYLKSSIRSRVIISSGERILLIRNWLGPGDFTLPGGGIHKNEKPKEGVVREIKEEIGLDIDANLLIPIIEKFLASEKGHRYSCYSYSLKLSEVAKINRQKFEIAEIKWVETSDVLSKYRLGSVAKQLIVTWLDHNHLLD